MTFRGESLMAVQFAHIAVPVFVPCALGSDAVAFQRECGGKPLYRVNIRGKG